MPASDGPCLNARGEIVRRRHKRCKTLNPRKIALMGIADELERGHWRRLTCGAAVAVALLAPAPAAASPDSQAQAKQAAIDFYNLDLDRAIEGFRAAVEADGSDAAAARGLASALWMSAGMLRGSVTVDSYLGGISRDDVKLPEPPRPLADEFHRTVDRAVEAARRRLERGETSADAHYDLGAALGLRASYSATIEGSLRSAFGAAREAFNAHEQVLELDRQRRDAGLIVGTYRYMVASFSMPVRWFAYMAGFGGGRDKGLQLIEEAASYGGENEIESRIALVLIYNRERRYADALAQLAVLRTRSPRNRLLWLESGSTALRAGRQDVAERFLDDGVARLASDPRPRMFGEEALWYYKRGVARARLGRAPEAERDLKQAVASPGRPWVHGQSHLELGKLALKAGNRGVGTSELRQTIALAERDNDPEAAAEARRLLR